MTDYAKIGTIVLLQRHAPLRGRGRPHAAYPQARPGTANLSATGWFTPTIIYDKMRAIDPAARELDALMRAQVKNPSLLAAWTAWYGRWQVFFAKYESAWATSHIAALFYTDDLARQTEGYRSELASFRATYAVQRDPATGQPLLQPSTPIPEVLKKEKDEDKDEGIDWWAKLGIKVPWWVWMLGGVAAVGGAYYLYKVVQGGRKTIADTGAKKRALEGTLPRMLGPELGHAAQASAGDPEHGPKALVPSDLFVDAPPPARHVHQAREARHAPHARHPHAHDRDPSSDVAADTDEEDTGD